MKDKLLQAARANDIPAGQSGLWEVHKISTEKPILANHCGKIKVIEPGSYTYLSRFTESTMHLNHGECVMHDTPEELQTHLQFMLAAHGRVLITGLGLGCVLRGCLANPAVAHCTVIERSQDVLRLVAPYLPKDRFTIIEAEAVEWCQNNGNVFDCAWHDLWTDEDHGEPHLAVVHADLMAAMVNKVEFQGAWAFPRYFKRQFRECAKML